MDIYSDINNYFKRTGYSWDSVPNDILFDYQLTPYLRKKLKNLEELWKKDKTLIDTDKNPFIGISHRHSSDDTLFNENSNGIFVHLKVDEKYYSILVNGNYQQFKDLEKKSQYLKYYSKDPTSEEIAIPCKVTIHLGGECLSPYIENELKNRRIELARKHIEFLVIPKQEFYKYAEKSIEAIIVDTIVSSAHNIIISCMGKSKKDNNFNKRNEMYIKALSLIDSAIKFYNNNVFLKLSYVDMCQEYISECIKSKQPETAKRILEELYETKFKKMSDVNKRILSKKMLSLARNINNKKIERSIIEDMIKCSDNEIDTDSYIRKLLLLEE